MYIDYWLKVIKIFNIVTQWVRTLEGRGTSEEAYAC